MRQVRFSDKASVPSLGQGTWRMGEDPAKRHQETAAIRLGIDLGMTVIDTAEMYGDGKTESFLGEALSGLREKVFLVSKVYPQNAGRRRLQQSCEASLRRLRTERIDLYLLHWRGSVPLAETVDGMETLKATGKIAAWGVSNFDLSDMADLMAAGGEACAANQILYNITRRGPEFDLIPAMGERGMAVMAYSPVEQGRLPDKAVLTEIAQRHGVTPYQIALAWTLRFPNIIAIPKASNAVHVQENHRAAELILTDEELASIDAIFPPPKRKTALQML